MPGLRPFEVPFSARTYSSHIRTQNTESKEGMELQLCCLGICLFFTRAIASLVLDAKRQLQCKKSSCASVGLDKY